MWLAVALAYSGLTGVCLAMNRHHRQVWHRPASSRRALLLRLAGLLLLAGSVVACMSAEGTARGIVAWFGIVSVTAVGLVALLPVSPRAAWILAWVAPWPALLLAWS
jgi:hypothetical protein